MRVDLGYLGIKSDYRGEQIDILTRKPRKSQKHLNPPLSEEQKAANTALSRVRIFIEHAIGGMKRYNILAHTFRNRIEHFEDEVIGKYLNKSNFTFLSLASTNCHEGTMKKHMLRYLSVLGCGTWFFLIEEQLY